MITTTITKQHKQGKTGLRFLIWDTFTGLCCYLVFAVVFVGVYALLGFGIGHLIYYAFNTILMMPISFHDCFVIALIPIINIIAGGAALLVLTWTLVLMVAWKVLIWLLGVLPGLLDAWARNIKR